VNKLDILVLSLFELKKTLPPIKINFLLEQLFQLRPLNYSSNNNNNNNLTNTHYLNIAIWPTDFDALQPKPGRPSSSEPLCCPKLLAFGLAWASLQLGPSPS
jgi:hypothetical protein